MHHCGHQSENLAARGDPLACGLVAGTIADMATDWKLNAPNSWTREHVLTDVHTCAPNLAAAAGTSTAAFLAAFDAATLQTSRSGFVWKVPVGDGAAVALKAHSPIRSAEQIRATLAAASYYAIGGACLAPLATPPIEGDSTCFSLWPWVDRDLDAAGEDGFTAVAHASAAWHRQDPVSGPFPVWDPIDYLAGRTAELRQAGHGELADEIAAGWDLVEEAYRRPRRLGQTVVHGDAHPGNLVGSAQQPRLIDVDRVKYAPAVSDLLRLAGWTAALDRPAAWWDNAVAVWAAGVGADVDDVEADVAALLPVLVATTTCSAALIAQFEDGAEDRTPRWLAAWRATQGSSTLLRPPEVGEAAGRTG